MGEGVAAIVGDGVRPTPGLREEDGVGARTCDSVAPGEASAGILLEEISAVLRVGGQSRHAGTRRWILNCTMLAGELTKLRSRKVRTNELARAW